MDLSLSQKEEYLKSTPAITTVEDWQLLTDGDNILSEQIVKDLNDSFKNILDALQAKKTYSWGEVGELFGSAMQQICNKYDPNALHGHYGLRDSEAHLTVARYIALNIDIAMYHYARYKIIW